MAQAWLSQFEDADSDLRTDLVPSDLEPLDYRIITLLFEGTV